MRNAKLNTKIGAGLLTLGLLLLLCCEVKAQGKLYSGTAQLPGSEGVAQVNFTLDFIGANGQIVNLNSAGKTVLYSSGCQISGLSEAQEKLLSLTLTFSGLPVSIPSVDLKHRQWDFNKHITLPSSAEHSLVVEVKAAYDGTAIDITPANFSFSRQFVHPNAAQSNPVVVQEEETPTIETSDSDPPERETPAEVQNNNSNNSNRPAPVVPASEPELTPAERAFAQIGKDGYTAKNYFDEWRGKPDKNDRLLRKALQQIPIASEAREVTDGYLLIFDYTAELQLDSIDPDPGFGDMEPLPLGDYRYNLSFPKSAVADYRLFLSDPSKDESLRVLKFSLNNLLKAELVNKSDTATITIKIDGGQPPYQLYILRDGREYANLVSSKAYEQGQASYDEDSQTWTIDRAFLAELVNETGEYTFQLYDGTGSANSKLDDETIQLVRPKTPLPAWLIYVGGALALLLLWSALRGRGKKRTRERARNELEKMDSSRKSGMSAITSSRDKPTETEKAKNDPIDKNVASGFRISKRVRDRELNTFNFRPESEPSDFLPLALKRNWRNSLIEKVLFSRQAINALDHFLRMENTSKVVSRTDGDKWERNEAIPEIGGMLMGQYRKDAAGNFRVSVEEFIPLEARAQNVIKVEIDPLSLARDLGRMQDEHPELTVVGWFHTHPGHGLFLSEPDLKVQLGHFRKPFQFAMEIDSLSEHLDTAFFSYQTEGVINNREQKVDGSSWFSWVEIEKFTRRKLIS